MTIARIGHRLVVASLMKQSPSFLNEFRRRRFAGRIALAMVLPLAPSGMTGFIRIQESPPTSAVPQPMDYPTIVLSVLKPFQGGVCHVAVGTQQCPQATINVADGKVIFIDKGAGSIFASMPILGLQASVQTIHGTVNGVASDTSMVRVNGSVMLTFPIPDSIAPAQDVAMVRTAWAAQAAATMAAALTQLAGAASQEWSNNTLISIMARAYRSLAVKPVLGDDVRFSEAQAEDAVRRQKWQEAAVDYRYALRIAPWWPGGYLNIGLINAQLGYFPLAIEGARHYLEFLPDAPNAREVQDRIPIWQAQDKSGFVEPDPSWFVEPPKPGEHLMGAMLAPVPQIVAAARQLSSSDGALLLLIIPGSPAQAAGIAAEDIVVSFAGQPVKNISDLQQAVKNAPPGMAIPVEVFRGSKRLKLTVRL